MIKNDAKTFKLIVGPGSERLRSSDYWAIFILCAFGALVLFYVVGQSI
jgi:hypothetical protein